jgi:hypothetical protein
MPFLKENVMENYDFREMRKTLVTMFSFDEINLLDDELNDEIKSEIYKSQHKEPAETLDVQPKVKKTKLKKKICNIF